MGENPREPIKLNRAESEGLRHVIAERDRHLREANELDQYLRHLIVELVTCHGKNVQEGWTLDLPSNQIAPTEPPTPPKTLKESAKKKRSTPKEETT